MRQLRRRKIIDQDHAVRGTTSLELRLSDSFCFSTFNLLTSLCNLRFLFNFPRKNEDNSRVISELLRVTEAHPMIKSKTKQNKTHPFPHSPPTYLTSKQL